MHTTNISLGDTQNNYQKTVSINHADLQNTTKTENKSTEAIHAVTKTEQKTVSDKNKQEREVFDTQLKENIIQEKLLNSYVEQQTITNDAITNEIVSKEKNVALAKAPTDGMQTQTPLQVAVKKQDVLESVKSVKADGTETYFFPVPVEVLTQLPPPGNLGLSAKMLDDIIEKSKQEDIQDNEKIKVEVVKQNSEKIELDKKIAVEETKDTEKEIQATKANKDYNNTLSLRTPFSE